VDAAITQATNQIASQYKNNFTTNILFVGVHAGTNSFLAGSISGQTVYTYGQYTGALAADSAANQNKFLKSAVANLGFGKGAGDPSALIGPTTTDARMLGLTTGIGGDSSPEFQANGFYLGGGGSVDGIIFINVDQPFSWTRPTPNWKSGIVYDAIKTIEHEVDEVLGGGGAGSMLNAANIDPNYAQDFYGVTGNLYGPLDLYRYQAPGVPSFDPNVISVTGCGPPTCSGLPSPYFSIDGGATAIDTFNQAFPLIGGDAGDWGLNLFRLCPGGTGIGGTGDVQDAFSCNNHASDVRPGQPSYKMLAAIGYDPAQAPEPATWAVMLVGMAGLGAVLRNRRRALAEA
jgi:hypothetical protein